MSTLYVQWNQYGHDNFGGYNGWLSQRIDAAASIGMSIWLGLYTDPNYFSKIHASEAEQSVYLEQYFARLEISLMQHPLWLNNRNKLKGIYVPIELSDYDYDSVQKRSQVSKKLAEFRGISDTPIAISMYLSGQTPVEDIRVWIDQLEEAGVRVLLQDGRGTRLISDSRWESFESEIECNVGLIREIFRQHDKEMFTASRLPREAVEEKMGQSGCHEQIFFSLRYLPIASQALSLAD